MSKYLDYCIEQEGLRSAEEMMIAKTPKPKKVKRRCADCYVAIDDHEPHRTLCEWCRFKPSNYNRGRV